MGPDPDPNVVGGKILILFSWALDQVCNETICTHGHGLKMPSLSPSPFAAPSQYNPSIIGQEVLSTQAEY